MAVKEFGVDTSLARRADDEPLYKVEPIAPTAVNAIVALMIGVRFARAQSTPRK